MFYGKYKLRKDTQSISANNYVIFFFLKSILEQDFTIIIATNDKLLSCEFVLLLYL